MKNEGRGSESRISSIPFALCCPPPTALCTRPPWLQASIILYRACRLMAAWSHSNRHSSRLTGVPASDCFIRTGKLYIAEDRSEQVRPFLVGGEGQKYLKTNARIWGTLSTYGTSQWFLAAPTTSLTRPDSSGLASVSAACRVQERSVTTDP
ncbi:hypothetical protein L227DRAFT_422107 [Lentinus tigrinus ALCF2SS1-6]|uniref:Uncharacterized protein n=1 Tax=Lentinus tigrinus ALCF2SS1-6 TaxID=1328759 RepID=A0A5C2RQA4_9APHY|nr:hypothetical protein L227DRAFT_422107 [Lentinus tigrinus ALCF2SS1-6]